MRKQVNLSTEPVVRGQENPPPTTQPAKQEVIKWSALPDCLDDAAAAAADVNVGGLYRTGSVIKVRVA